MVAVANNGREALVAWEREPFDIVLMDVQMPEMDGLESTRRIREIERGQKRRTPIIAMTASAMKGDRQRCLEAGMDGYISKPVKRRSLFAEIARVLDASGAQPGAGESVAFDESALMARIDGSMEFLNEAITILDEDGTSLLERIHAAVAARDAPALATHAHTLKGMLANFCAPCAEGAARELESMAREERLTDVEAAAARVQRETARLHDALGEFLRSRSE